MPQVVITAAKCDDYNITDEKTGKENKGRAGRVWGFRCKKEGKQGIVGMTTFAISCDAPVADMIKAGLDKAKAPLIAHVDFDVKGSGANLKQNCIDAAVIGIFNLKDWAFTEDGLQKRVAQIDPTRPSQAA